MKYDVVIVGGGPGGLACAAECSRSGLRTLLLERNGIVGRKVCAGGITYNGLIKTVPDDITEGRFAKQTIVSSHQRCEIQADTPIIATVNREHLGRVMMAQAERAGAEIRLGCRVDSIESGQLSYVCKATGERESVNFSYLVGADGAASVVRRFLGVATSHFGVGITCQVPGNFTKMEWHLNRRWFGNGYAWIFPHSSSASVGAYVDYQVMSPALLKKNLKAWAAGLGIILERLPIQAERIAYDYRGYGFGNCFLVGDAAGLSSALTGEGIYSAIVSGEEVARCITNPAYPAEALKRLIRNHRRHRRVVEMTRNNNLWSGLAMELAVLGLRSGILPFSAAEMAH